MLLYVKEKLGDIMIEYKFYGNESKDVLPMDEKYKMIKNQRHLYDILDELWEKKTCAPRLQDGWSEDNKTLGQCSITAFLVQDIFGGEVRGILRPGGNYHCYNVVGDSLFDLTSEQFGDEVLDYTDNPIQSREEHFSKQEKYERYLYLKDKLNIKLGLK